MISKMIMFAASLVSRGPCDRKTDIPTKQLRVLSCFGGGPIKTRCPFLRQSDKDPSKSYCGACGCGDHKHTWLMAEGEEYSKLDYPVLHCPHKMPGFTNYDPNHLPDEMRWRKETIQAMDPEELKVIQVTIGQSEEKEALFEQIQKAIDQA